MPRALRAVRSPEETNDVVARLLACRGVLSVSVSPNAGRRPVGDAIDVACTNRTLHEVLPILCPPGVAYHSSKPLSFVVPGQEGRVRNDDGDATWAEIEQAIDSDTAGTINFAVVMTIAGALAALGVATNALALVIGALVLDGGFEPIVGFGLGAIRALPGSVLHSLKKVGGGYACVVLGGIFMGILLPHAGVDITGASGGYDPAHQLYVYWSEPSWTNALTAALAGSAGALLLATNQSVLTAGAMIALDLTPSAALAGMALVSGHLITARNAALLWIIDAVTITLAALAVFAWKRWTTHRGSA
jgi:hypothetical protein